ncbi:hypothetical protein CYY_004495 [Polysphondylium violaceum]|nr:hypothetical protein CYY_004495 [Polysphondylium violaceum]
MIKNILVILVFLCVLQQQYVQAQRFTYRTTITNANPSTVSSQLSDEYLYLFNPMNLYRYSLSSLPFQIEKGVTFVGAASSNSFDYITPVISPRDTLWFNIDSKYGLMYYNQDGMYEFSNMNSSSILTNAGFVIDAIDSISVFNFLQPYHLCTYSTQNKIVRHNDFHIPTTPTNL